MAKWVPFFLAKSPLEKGIEARAAHPRPNAPAPGKKYSLEPKDAPSLAFVLCV